jgi:hypothetical protein
MGIACAQPILRAAAEIKPVLIAKRLMAAGLSRFEPDPMAALKQTEQRRAS